MKKQPSYLDAWLIAFLALMIAASLIAAHGAYIFFSYLLDWWVAALATTVTAAGIPALDAAATLEQSRKRWLYWIGAFTFLAMETLANYFSGQAVFLANVLQAFAGKSGADLVWLAEQPAGRVLVVIYLAMPSLIVAYFAYAAASRWRAIRDARVDFANGSRRSSQLRALVVRLSRMVRELRANLAHAQADVARLTQEARERAAHAAREAADLREQLAQARALAREKISQAANIPPTRAALIGYARERLAQNASLADVSRETGWPESSLRGYLKEVANGVEAIN